VSWGDINEFQLHSRTLVSEAAYRGRTWGFTDDSPAPVEVVLSGQITRGFFETLGVHPRIGSGFAPADELVGSNHVIWLTGEFWRRRYSRNLDVLGRIVRLNNAAYRIAGILPEGFQFAIAGANPDVYIPLDRADYCCARESRTLKGIGRLAPGSTRAAASAEMTALSEPAHFDAVRLESALLGSWERSLFFLAIASALLMLVAATNGAAILLARTVRTLRDTAIRASLGANFGRLVREQAIHGLLIGVASAVVGVVLGIAALRVAKIVPVFAAVLLRYSSVAELRTDYVVAALASGLALLSALAAALAPLWLVRRMNLDAILRRGASGSQASVRLRNALVVLQIGASFVLLLVGASVLDQLRRTLNSDHGFRTDQIVIAGIGIPESPYDTDEKVIEIHERILRRMTSIPGVTAAGGGAWMPFASFRARFQPPGQNLSKKDQPVAALAVVSPGLLDLLGIPLVEGREFTSDDRTKHPLVALVNHAFTDRHRAGTGARLRIGWASDTVKSGSEFEIIGVVGDTQNRALDAPPEPAIFLSTLQFPLDGCLYFVKTGLPASTVAESIRQAVWSEDPKLERVNVRPFAPYVERGLESRRLAIWLCGCFGLVALLLAATGLYASISTWVTESRREIAIRAALGERSGQTAWRVVAKCLRLAAVGGLCGVAGSFALESLLRSEIDGFSSLGVVPLVVTGLTIGCATLVASAMPAYLAARGNPAELLTGDQ
jgi:predicted permease